MAGMVQKAPGGATTDTPRFFLGEQPMNDMVK
jgi:hypothetical protein